jgi:Tol biopolymer transport system component
MRALAIVVLLALMAAFGLAVYHVLDSQKRLRTTVQQPTETSALSLPGTIYLAQSGSLYRFQHGTFTRLTAADGWMQPSLSPDGTRLVAVKRGFNSSDLYLLDTRGQVQQQLTHNGSNVVEHNHWSYYPRFSADGQSIFYSYDPKDSLNSYRVDLAVFAVVPGSRLTPRQWSFPNEYTGGDVSPIPLKNGALIYAKNSIDADGKVHSQVWIQARAGSTGVGLTQLADDCGQPALSASGTELAMACRRGGASTEIEVAQLDVASYSIRAPVVVVPAGLNASPAFSPDGQSLIYFAPAGGAGPFQLWTVGLTATATSAASPSPAAAAPAPKQVTHNLAFDSSAPPAWG